MPVGGLLSGAGASGIPASSSLGGGEGAIVPLSLSGMSKDGGVGAI